MGTEALPQPEEVRGYVDYLRDLGIFDLFAADVPSSDAALDWVVRLGQDSSGRSPQQGRSVLTNAADRPARHAASIQSTARPTPGAVASSAAASPFERSVQRFASTPPPSPVRPAGPQITVTPAAFAAQAADESGSHDIFAEAVPPPVSFNQLAPLPVARVAPAERAAALAALRQQIGDCTRCPLAYAGRHSIVFGDGNSAARLMFVGEGPGADEDESGIPFVGKAGQLLNNMIAAMGLQREAVYIANVVKCRPPKNRTPEPVEANTCSPFLLQQIDIVQPEVIVALGATAATYLLGVRQSLSSLRGRWFDVRGARCAVTYHPAYLLRDPRQKGEAWKDLQRVIAELKLKPPARA